MCTSLSVPKNVVTLGEWLYYLSGHHYRCFLYMDDAAAVVLSRLVWLEISATRLRVCLRWCCVVTTGVEHERFVP